MIRPRERSLSVVTFRMQVRVYLRLALVLFDAPQTFDISCVSLFLPFSGSGPNSRTSQLFIAYAPQDSFGKELWETPIGRVVEGMDAVVDKFYSGYGDMPPWGHGPVQQKIREHGLSYMQENFPESDRFETCVVVRINTDKDGERPQDDELSEAQQKEADDEGKTPETMNEHVPHHGMNQHIQKLRSNVGRNLDSIGATETQLYYGAGAVAFLVLLCCCMIARRQGNETKSRKSN